MKKVGIIFVLLLIATSFLVSSQEVNNNVEKYAETTGVYLLKFQNLVMGALSFVSLGVFKDGGTAAFIQFLFIILLFMILYDIISFFTIRFVFLGSLILTVVAFSVIDVNSLQILLINYESMGVAITVVLPVLILLTFTFRIYQKAYEGESDQSPFYAEIFNLIFLIFFGIFFIRYSRTEEGFIALARFGSGFVLIGLGFAQFLLYKIFVNMLDIKLGKGNEEEEIKKMKREAAEKIEDLRTEEIFSYSKGMRRGGVGNKSGRFVKRSSMERYSKRFGDDAAKKRFGG